MTFQRKLQERTGERSESDGDDDGEGEGEGEGEDNDDARCRSVAAAAVGVSIYINKEGMRRCAHTTSLIIYYIHICIHTSMVELLRDRLPPALDRNLSSLRWHGLGHANPGAFLVAPCPKHDVSSP